MLDHGSSLDSDNASPASTSRIENQTLLDDAGVISLQNHCLWHWWGKKVLRW